MRRKTDDSSNFNLIKFVYLNIKFKAIQEFRKAEQVRLTKCRNGSNRGNTVKLSKFDQPNRRFGVKEETQQG